MSGVASVASLRGVILLFRLYDLRIWNSSLLLDLATVGRLGLVLSSLEKYFIFILRRNSLS